MAASVVQPRPRLQRSNPNKPGFQRVKAGRGFSYRDPSGNTVQDAELKARFSSLAIPPAWTEVWIAPSAFGHIQATGLDAAGRRQYLYHERWRERRDRIKFNRALDLAATLPAARAKVTRAFHQSDDVSARVFAAAFRMLDTGCLRIGSERYADENGSRGLSTLLCEHVSVRGDSVSFSFPAKSGQLWNSEIHDADLARFVTWRRRRGGPSTLLSWVDGHGEHALSADDINTYVRLVTGGDFTAKDFRTLRGTVTAAASLAAEGPQSGQRLQAMAISRAIGEASRVLGNTPAIARASYVDPRLLDRYRAGETIDPSKLKSAESQVRLLLGAPER